MKARCGVVLAEISPTKTTACRVIGCDHAAPASAEMTSANSSRRQPRISNRCRFGKGSELRRHVRKTRAAIGTKSSRSNGCSNVSMLAPSLFSHAPGGFRQAFFRDAVTAIEFVLYRGHEAGWFCGCFYATDGAAALARAGRCRLRAVVAAEEPPFGAEDE